MIEALWKIVLFFMVTNTILNLFNFNKNDGGLREVQFWLALIICTISVFTFVFAM